MIRNAKPTKEGKRFMNWKSEGSIVVYAYAVVARNADGSTTVKQSDDAGTGRDYCRNRTGKPHWTSRRTGRRCGGSCHGVRWRALLVDVNDTRIAQDFLEDVRKELQPNKFAVVAEIKEDETQPVDTRMEAIGGTVFRRALKEVKHKVNDEEVAAMKADMAQLKAEHAKAHADRKAKLQEKINQLDSKIQARLEKNKQRRQAAEAQEKAKVEVLKAKAAALKAKAAGTHTS